VEKGRIQLDGRVSDYLPDYPALLPSALPEEDHCYVVPQASERRQVDECRFELQVFVQLPILGLEANAPFLGQVQLTAQDAANALDAVRVEGGVSWTIESAVVPWSG
jgi:hypothetical protein